MDIFAPRKTLTDHLQALVDDGTLRRIGQHDELGEVLGAGTEPLHRAVYVSYDGYSNVSTQSHRSQKLTQKYTLLLAWRNARPSRSGQGNGMDEAGEVLSKLMLHIEGLAVGGDKPGHSRRFTLTESENAFYRPGGWAFYPLTFQIDIINI